MYTFSVKRNYKIGLYKVADQFILLVLTFYSWIRAPNATLILIPRTCECYLYGKRDFTEVIKVQEGKGRFEYRN